VCVCVHVGCVCVRVWGLLCVEYAVTKCCAHMTGDVEDFMTAGTGVCADPIV